MTQQMADNVAFSATIDLLALYLQIKNHNGGNWEKSRKWLARVGNLKDVAEVCDSHQVWIRYDIQTRDYAGIGHEIALLMGKIHRLHQQYTRPAP